jgi:hypothetical protein
VNKPRPSLEERIEKLQEGFFGPAREINEADPIEPTPMAAPIDRIPEYDRNPRRERNEAYDEIETSIRQRGFIGTLPITQRPGEPHYRVAEGGNTVRMPFPSRSIMSSAAIGAQAEPTSSRPSLQSADSA